MENEKYPYQKEWEDYKRRERIYWSMFFFLFPLHFLYVQIAKVIQVEAYSYFLLIFWVLLIVSLIRLETWKCPRCKETFHFFIRGFYNREQCKNCGLNKFEGSNLKRAGKRFGF